MYNQEIKNYLELKKLVRKIGDQAGNLENANAYNELKKALAGYGKILVNKMPKLRRYAEVIGYENISKKNILSYKK